ncbi:MAG: DNA mismatch repair endonuclease MutL [Flavobacteriales bacterium]|jgi:DNA mismatch repair protein MutL|nr:DNA mismatch repair endonuclease MutL [Flavobacteriales bacterium]
MSDIIRLLPDHVANQIAAGEVVQRPASVVKELLENSVDAGAGKITLVVKDAGRTLIQVTDDGKGMSATDARTCFERHATSKIRLADDLQTVRTKGFRGEALASIAAIAQVELKTRQEGKDLGTRVLIEGSRVQAQEAIACPVGSSLHVRSLFYNVPARRQFLKSDPVEMKHVIEEFQRVALAHPGVRFRLLHNEQELFHLEPGNERQRIVGVFGRKFDERLVPVEEATEFVRVEGFVTKPEFAKRNRGEQYFFVNSRFIRSPYLEHAVRRAYEELIARDNYPGWFLFLELDPAWIDINIHPTKTEIKFRDDRTVYAIVHAAVRRALGRHNITPSIDFEPEPALLMGATATGPVRGEPPVSSGRWRPTDLPPQTSSAGWQQLFDLGTARVTQHDEMLPGFAPKEEEHPLPLHTEVTGNRPVFQLLGHYMLAQLKSGFVVVDQQRAMERIMYERSMRSLEAGSGSSQAQLFPVTMELNAPDHALLLAILPELHALGFQLEPLSGRSVAVNGMPAESGAEDPAELLGQLLEQVHNERGSLKAERHATLARGMARSVMSQPVKRLGTVEMHDLIDRLFACEMPYFTPGGKPVLITYGQHELDERFER